MTVKLALLKSGETIISDAKEIVYEETKEVHSYLFENPHVVTTRQKMLLTEDETPKNDFSLDVVLSPWIVLSKDKKMSVPKDWVVTLVDPLNDVATMYDEKCGSSLNIEPIEE